MHPIVYIYFYQALADRGISLINNPSQYRLTHWLPKNYAMIEGVTPRSVWLPNEVINTGEIQRAVESLGGGPVVVKDYVKSEKHYWTTAMFIPTPHDTERVVAEFERCRGQDLERGLVFREYIPLVGPEYRIWYFDGEPIYVTHHDESS